jgi:predicted GTPase
MKGDLPQERIRTVILGAAGRDFHNFNMLYRNAPAIEVVAFAAAQIPEIGGCRYFIQGTDERVAIGALSEMRTILEGQAGTTVHPSLDPGRGG